MPTCICYYLIFLQVYRIITKYAYKVPHVAMCILKSIVNYNCKYKALLLSTLPHLPMCSHYFPNEAQNIFCSGVFDHRIYFLLSFPCVWKRGKETISITWSFRVATSLKL